MLFSTPLLIEGKMNFVNDIGVQATRTLIVRKLKGLEDFISFSSVHWHMGEKGKFRFPSAL